MLRIFLLISLFFLSAESRENPFFPIDSAQDIPLTSNQVQTVPMLKRATLTLPSTARTIQSVTVAYKNLDGSIVQKKVIIKNRIDWHLPIFISQNYNITNRQTPPFIKKKKSAKKLSYKKITSLKFIAFYAYEKRVKILTKDKLLRNFLLVKPQRIVCDFKRNTDIGSFIKKAYKGSLFTKIKVGTHKGYYRVVIELDGYYTYKLSHIPGGYMITLL